MTADLTEMSRADLVALWRDLNDSLGECDFGDYDGIIDERSAVEEELDPRR